MNNGKKVFIMSAFVLLLEIISILSLMILLPDQSIRDNLMIIIPVTLELNFLLLVIGILINYDRFKEIFKNIKRKVYIYLGIIISLGLFITAFVVPRDHRIYYDEDIYENIAQNMVLLKSTSIPQPQSYKDYFSNISKMFSGRTGMCHEGETRYDEYRCYRMEYNKDPSGWPYIMGNVFRVFGVKEIYAFATNNLIYVLSVLLVFLITFVMFDSSSAGLFSSLVFAFTPQNMIWSNTAAAEPSAALFAGIAFFFAMLYSKHKERKLLFLSVVSLAFATQFRPESLLIVLPVSIFLLYNARSEIVKADFFVFFLLFFALLAPHILHLWSVKDMSWGEQTGKFGMSFFSGNLRANLLYYLRNIRFPILFSVFFICAFALKERGSFIKENPLKGLKISLIAWFLSFFGIFIFFYAGSYNYGMDVRFSLVCAIPFSIIAGLGAVKLGNLLKSNFGFTRPFTIILLVFVFNFVSFLPLISAQGEEAWDAREDHVYAKELAKLLPDDSIVLTHNPNMFLLWGKNAAQASMATEYTERFAEFFNRFRGGVFFHYNYWCNASNHRQNTFCTNILGEFDAELIKSYTVRTHRYELYRIRVKSKKR